ncbi:MAG: 30S ribosomal protein S12 methylthiotransferase RimO [Bacteroidales bacterium]|jgi:ribosomal protein S12 methylthiotransferase|nr:30S ribosomal protein S12 methylthiotransferase RimO [Bacteroidales bacterium]
MALTINIISLGCSKNTVDSEFIAGGLANKGYDVGFDLNKKYIDITIINTCGFIHDAKQESINTILLQCALKKSNKVGRVIVCGCLSQRYEKELQEELPLVDAFFGVGQYDSLLAYLERENEEQLYNKTRLLSTPKHYAYLKIAEGCNRNCSYCAIPIIRGKNISRRIEDIIEEANKLVEEGVKEIILVAQDTTYYGVDLYGKRRLYDLLKELVKIDKLKWIRIQYAYPQAFPLEVLDLMQKEEKICKYIDIPLQHISNSVLDSMKRHITSTETENLIKQIREKVAQISIRTTFIVGYPNETKEDFSLLKEFVKKSRFERMGCFTYSPEEGTKAFLLEDNVSEEEKQERMDELLDIQQEISLELNQEKIGKVFEVIIDRKDLDFFVGRTQYDSPEVDNEVLISDKYSLEVGEFYNIKIVDAVEFDLIGEVIYE